MALNKTYLLLLLFPSISVADPSASPDLCASLFAVLNRPTVANSACVVKEGEVLIEMGFQYQGLYPESGNGTNFPEADLRFGLPLGNEISVLTPNYYNTHTDAGSVTGSTATVVGLKHQFPIIQKWTYAVESLYTLPSGNDNFGSNAVGIAINGLVNYNFTSAIAVTVMLGVTSQTTSFNAGGERYNSFNPDLVLTWQTSDKVQLFAEVYGQTKTSPEKDDGYNADGGVQYLITENIEVDAEYGLRLSGALGGFSHYFGVGGGIRF